MVKRENTMCGRLRRIEEMTENVTFLLLILDVDSTLSYRAYLQYDNRSEGMEITPTIQ